MNEEQRRALEQGNKAQVQPLEMQWGIADTNQGKRAICVFSRPVGDVMFTAEEARKNAEFLLQAADVIEGKAPMPGKEN